MADIDTIQRIASFVVLYGVSYGVVLFTISLGMVLTLGLMRIVNLAHGAFAAVGGYSALVLMNSLGFGFLPAVLVAAVAVGVGSIVVERVFYVPLYKANELDQVLMTVGLMYVTTATLNLFFGPDPMPEKLPDWLSANVDLGVRKIQFYRLFIVGVGAVLIVALWFMFERTALGARLRAAVDNRGMAAVMAIDVAKLFSITFAIGSGLAAFGGAVGYPMLPLEPLYPFKYLTMVLIVVTLAGMGNIRAVAPAAILVGLVDTASRFFFPVTGAFAVYVMFVIAMVLRREAGPHRSHIVYFATPTESFKPREIVFWLALLAVYVLFPDHLSLATAAAIMALFAVSLDLVLGFAGVVTLGHGVFFGVGAYVAAWMALAGWQEPLTGLVVAGLAAAALALILGPVLLRKRGLVLIMGTFVLALIFFEIGNKVDVITGGDNGLTGFTFDPILGVFRWSVFAKTEYLYALACLFVLFYLAKRLVASPFGLALQGIRENPDRMSMIGAPVLGHLVRIYALSAFIAGVAGALSAQTTRFVALSAINLDISINALVMLTLGGVGALYGAVVGAGVYMVVHQFASEWNPYHWMFIIGFMLLIVVRLGHGGLVGLQNLAIDRLTAIVKFRTK